MTPTEQEILDALPKVGEPEDVWCTVHASTLREALDALRAAPAAREHENDLPGMWDKSDLSHGYADAMDQVKKPAIDTPAAPAPCASLNECTTPRLCGSVGTCKGQHVLPANVRAEMTAAAPQAEPAWEMMPTPEIVAYAGGAAPGGLYSWIDIKLGDGPEQTRYVRAQAEPADEQITRWAELCEKGHGQTVATEIRTVLALRGSK